MADFGIGEAAAAEGAKTAGEAAAAEGVAAGAAEGAGAGMASTAAGEAVAGGAGEAMAGGAGAVDSGMVGTMGQEVGAGAFDGGGMTSTAAQEAVTGGAGEAASVAIPNVIPNALPPIETVPGEVTAPVPESMDSSWYQNLVPGNNYSAAQVGENLYDTAAQEAQSQAEDQAKKKAQQSILEKALGKITDNPLPAAALGASLVSGLAQRNAAGQTSKQLSALGQPSLDVEKSLLSQYQSGQIPASAEFDIQTWQNQQTAAVRSQFARAGMSDSTAARNAEAQIAAKADAMRDQARQGLLTGGLQAAGVANSPMVAGIQAQANQDQQFAQSQASALNSLMLLQAMQSRGSGGS